MNHPKTTLKELGIIPRKKLGQNFLIHKHQADKIVSSISFDTNDSVIEIGPGLGILTEALAQKSNHLVAIEKDTKLFEYLTHNPLFPKNIEIVNQDFLEFKWPGSTVIIFGNIPYNITSPILRKLIENKSKVKKAVLMIPRDIGSKLNAQKGKDYGVISLGVQLHFKISFLFTVKPNNFYPVPKITSQVVLLEPKGSILSPSEEKVFDKIIATAFQKRRKMLRHIFPHFTDWEKIGIAPHMRPEEVSLEQYIEWARAPNNTSIGFC